MEEVKEVRKPLTKTQLENTLAEKTGLDKKEIKSVLLVFEELLGSELNAVGQFTLPGLLRVKKQHKPLKPARLGVPNPFKPGELMDIPEKPAHDVIKVVALKKLKEMV